MLETLSLIGFAKDTISWIVKFVQPKIEVKPKKLIITEGKWNKEGYFTVCNKTDGPLFDVQILLWLQKGTDLASHFRIVEIDDQGSDKKLKFGRIRINTDVFVVGGASNGKGIVLVQLQYLAPKGCKRVFYSVEQPFKESITLQAVSLSTSPSQTLKTTDKVAIPFTPPRNIVVSNISFLMRKADES